MSIFNAFKSLFSPGRGDATADAYWLYVQCNKCGEAIRIRINKTWDLAQEFGDDEQVSGYTLHKEILGQKCPQLIYVRQELDVHYRVQHQEVTNGRFLTQEEYEALAGGVPADSNSPKERRP